MSPGAVVMLGQGGGRGLRMSRTRKSHKNQCTRDICRYTGVSRDPLMASSHSPRFHGRSRSLCRVAVVWALLIMRFDDLVHEERVPTAMSPRRHVSVLQCDLILKLSSDM